MKKSTFLVAGGVLVMGNVTLAGHPDISISDS